MAQRRTINREEVDHAPRPVRQVPDEDPESQSGDPRLAPLEACQLARVLEEARSRGFLGPGAVKDHIRRALDLSTAVPRSPEQAVDLGSGAGVPGLPLALLWKHSRWVLLDGSTTRAAWLEKTVSTLDLASRVTVVARRAEEAARSDLRGTFDLAVARGFGPPGATAECGAPFLRPGGTMVVAEPPGGCPLRWDPTGLARLGMVPTLTCTHPTSYQCLLQVDPCPDTYPRRTGVPFKRPLF